MVNVIRANQLPLDAKIKMGVFQSHEADYSMYWRVVSTNHHTLDANYPSNAVTLITDDVINVMSFDAKEPDNDNDMRSKSGNNRYRLSNIRQWLNATLGATHWYYPQNIEGSHHYNDRDTPPTSENIIKDWRNNPYSDLNGFASMFRDYELASVIPTKIKTGVNDLYDYSPTVDGLERYDLTEDKFYLPSITELGFGNNDYYQADNTKSIAEGVALPYFNDTEKRKSSMHRVAFSNSKYNKALSKYTHDALVYNYMTRSPRLDSPTKFHLASDTLKVAHAPNDVYCLRPMCNINGETLVTATPDENGYYSIVGDVAPQVEINKINVLDVHFNVHDMQGVTTKVKAYFNGNLLQEFTTGFSDELVVTIPYNAISSVKNELIFITNDDGGLVGQQLFKLDIQSGLVNAGDKISSKHETFEVTNVVNNGDGTVTALVDRNLKYRIETDAKVEKMGYNYKPLIHFTKDYYATPTYNEMTFNKLLFNADNTVTELWSYNGDGVYSKTKIDIKRSHINDDAMLKSVSQIYKYKDEM